MNKKLFLFVLMSLFLTTSVLAFMPPSHYFIFTEAMKNKVDSNLYDACAKYPNLCYSGNILTDVSVLYYYTYYARYTVTHSPSFCRALLDNANGEEQLACAVGACTHQPPDGISHNLGVPYSIQHTFLPNGIIHVYAEQHLDNWVILQNPQAKDEALTSLASYKTCIPLFQKVLQGEKEYAGVDLTAMFDKFVQEIQGSKTGYDLAFSNITTIPVVVMLIYCSSMLLLIVLAILIIFKRLRFKERRTVFNWISLFIVLIILIPLVILFIGNLGGQAFNTFIMFVKPVSNLVPIYNPQYQVTQSISATTQFFQQGELFLIDKANQGLYASGTTSLAAADNSIAFVQWSVLIVLILLIILFIYFNFKSPKKAYSANINI
jgi:hypothetical protein